MYEKLENKTSYSISISRSTGNTWSTGTRNKNYRKQALKRIKYFFTFFLLFYFISTKLMLKLLFNTVARNVVHSKASLFIILCNTYTYE